MQFKSITVIAVLLLVVASLLVSGCTSSTDNNQATSSTPSAAAKTANTTTKAAASVSAKPSASASVISPTPKSTAMPTPVPKPQCNHIAVVVYFPYDEKTGLNLPCMMCSSRYADLLDYANQHSPYVTVTSQKVPNSSWGELTPRVSATVKETGVSQSFDPYGAPTVWINGALGC